MQHLLILWHDWQDTKMTMFCTTNYCGFHLSPGLSAPSYKATTNSACLPGCEWDQKMSLQGCDRNQNCMIMVCFQKYVFGQISVPVWKEWDWTIKTKPQPEQQSQMPSHLSTNSEALRENTGYSLQISKIHLWKHFLKHRFVYRFGRNQNHPCNVF